MLLVKECADTLPIHFLAGEGMARMIAFISIFQWVDVFGPLSIVAKKSRQDKNAAKTRSVLD